MILEDNLIDLNNSHLGESDDSESKRIQSNDSVDNSVDDCTSENPLYKIIHDLSKCLSSQSNK